MNPEKNSQLRERLLPYVELISDIDKYSCFYELHKYEQNIPQLGKVVLDYGCVGANPIPVNVLVFSWYVELPDEP